MKSISQKFFLILVFTLLFFSLQAAPSSNLWEKWAKNNSGNSQTINHAPWNDFLKKYVVSDHPSKVNLMKYKDVSSQDKKKLDRYISDLQSLKITNYNRNEQRAYWINLYNAFTVKLILDKYPVKSIREIKTGWFSGGPWDMEIARVEGEEMTLNDMEHRILRPIWKDNRVHYAVNCASYSCPNLAAEAFTAENTERLLEEGARSYVNHPRGATFEGDQLIVSSIYDWYEVDFGDNEKGVIQHLLKYARGEFSEKLKNYQGSLKNDYNWNLNEP